MNLTVGLYLALTSFILAHAYFVGRRVRDKSSQADRAVIRRPLPGPGPPVIRHKTKEGSQDLSRLQDPLAYRWKYLAVGFLGFCTLTLNGFLVPFVGRLFPGSFIDTHALAVCRFIEIPSIMVSHLGAYLSFSGKRQQKRLGDWGARYDFYKKLVEKYDLVFIDSFENLLEQLGGDIQEADTRVDALLSDPTCNVDDRAHVRDCQLMLRLVALSTFGKSVAPRRWPLGKLPIRAELLAIKRLREEFQNATLHTEPRRQAEEDRVAEVASEARLLSDPRPSFTVLTNGDDWMKIGAHVASDSGLIDKHQAAVLAAQVYRATSRILRADRYLADAEGGSGSKKS